MDLGRLLDTNQEGRLTVLDDIGAGRQTPWVVDQVALIVEHLHAINAFLVVTTNYAPSELALNLGGLDDPISGQRIVCGSSRAHCR
jgi:hypothetical protein